MSHSLKHLSKTAQVTMGTSSQRRNRALSHRHQYLSLAFRRNLPQRLCEQRLYGQTPPAAIRIRIRLASTGPAGSSISTAAARSPTLRPCAWCLLSSADDDHNFRASDDARG